MFKELKIRLRPDQFDKLSEAKKIDGIEHAVWIRELVDKNYKKRFKKLK